MPTATDPKPISEETRIRVDQIHKDKLLALSLRKGFEEMFDSQAAEGWNRAIEALEVRLNAEVLKLLS